MKSVKCLLQCSKRAEIIAQINLISRYSPSSLRFLPPLYFPSLLHSSLSLSSLLPSTLFLYLFPSFTPLFHSLLYFPTLSSLLHPLPSLPIPSPLSRQIVIIWVMTSMSQECGLITLLGWMWLWLWWTLVREGQLEMWQPMYGI